MNPIFSNLSNEANHQDDSLLDEPYNSNTSNSSMSSELSNYADQSMDIGYSSSALIHPPQ